MMDYDILIVGGGMVGASLACALKDVPFKVGVIEAVRMAAEHQPSFDARAIAMAEGSRRIFETLGLWPAMAQMGVTPIEHIHVSDRGHFGASRLHAEAYGVEALGYVVEAEHIGQALNPALEALPNVEMICPAQVTSLEFQPEQVEVGIERQGEQKDQQQVITARLVVAADGGHSAVRELVGTRVLRLGYGQTAVITTVTTDREHGGVAYERFTDSGPLALLPCDDHHQMMPEGLQKHRWSLVWTARDEEVDELLALSDEQFIHRLQQRFGNRAGNFVSCGQRHNYPLGLQYVREHVSPRLAFIGNAAHTLHPVAGQGFNLGLRDVAVLAEVLADAAVQSLDPGDMQSLKSYSDWRRPDHLKVMGLTDSLVRLFSNKALPVRLSRNLGLLAMDILPPVKRLLARQTMGLAGRLSRLARGLPLVKSGQGE